MFAQLLPSATGEEKPYEVDPLAIKKSSSEAIEDSGLEIASYQESDIDEEGDIYEEILHQFQSLLRGMLLEWPQSRREMTHRALHFAIAEREVCYRFNAQTRK